MAAFILSRLVHVFDDGDSDQSPEPYKESLGESRAALFRLSLAFGVEFGVDGLWDMEVVPNTGTAVGRARKNRWVY